MNTVVLKKQYLVYLLNVGSRGGSSVSSLGGLALTNVADNTT